MAFKGFLLILVLRTCRAQATGDYDVKSPAAVLGIILGAICVIAAIIIVIVLCVKNNRFYERRRRNTKANKKKKEENVKQKPTTITETLVERLPDIPEEDEHIGRSRVSIRDENNLALYQIAIESNDSKLSDVNEGIPEFAQVHKMSGNTLISSFELDEGHTTKYVESISSEINQEKTHSSNISIAKNIMTSKTKPGKKRQSNDDNHAKTFSSPKIKQKAKRSSGEDKVRKLSTKTTQEEKRLCCEKNNDKLATSLIQKGETQSSSEENVTKVPVSKIKEENKQSSNEDIVKKLASSYVKHEEKWSSKENILQDITGSRINQEEQPESYGDIVENFNNGQEASHDDIKDAVSITRVIKNETTLVKDLPFLNSTENIFEEYDPAMTYEVTSEWKSSKSEEGLNFSYLKREQKDIPPKDFEFTRDDSDLNLKSKSKLEAEENVEIKKNSNSEGMLTDDQKIKSLKRRSSIISRITSKSFEWNFDYISPYAMSDKQKRERLELTEKLRKRKFQTLKQKHENNEKKQYVNYLAYEKWKRQKLGEKRSRDIGSLTTRTLNRYRFWYP